MKEVILEKKGILLIIIGVLFLCGLGLGLYSSSFHAPFQFDDYIFVLKNDSVKNIENIELLWQRGDFRKRIIPFITFSLNYHFGRKQVFGYHLVNTFIHIFAALAVWWLVAMLSSLARPEDEDKKSVFFSFLVALLFLAHPIQTEAVTYISQRFTSLAGLFYILSACFYIKARRKMSMSDSWMVIIGSFLVSVLLGVCGLMTKETVFTLPLALLLIEMLFFSKRVVAKVLGFSVIGLGTVFTGIKFFHIKWKFIFLRLTSRGVTSWTYLLTQFKVFILYLGLLFFPINQNLDYTIELSKHFWELPTVGGFLLFCIIFSLGLYALKKNRLIAFGIFWFFITSLIESSILPINDFMAERRLYLPSIGFFIVIIEIFRMLYLRKKNVLIVLCVWILFLSFLTVKRNYLWRDPILLWKDVIKSSPDNMRAHHNLGLAYLHRKDYDKALYYFDKVISINPESFLAYNNRALIYRKLGKFELALDNYNKSIEIKPLSHTTYYGRGNVHFKLGNYEAAINDYKTAISHKWVYADAHVQLANTYKVLKKYDKALIHYREVLRITPDSTGAYNNLANLYADMKIYDKSLENYNRAIELNPYWPDSYNNRGVIFNMTDRSKEALADYNKAIELNPEYVEAYYNRGNILALTGDYDNAIKDYNKALSIKKIPQALFSRATVYFNMGQYSLSIQDCDVLLIDFPAYADVYTLRAQAKEGLGDIMGAESDREKAQALLQDN